MGIKRQLPEIHFQFIVDEQGKKTAAIMDISTHGVIMELLEDMYLGARAEKILSEEKEYETLEDVRKELLGDEDDV